MPNLVEIGGHGRLRFDKLIYWKTQLMTLKTRNSNFAKRMEIAVLEIAIYCHDNHRITFLKSASTSLKEL